MAGEPTDDRERAFCEAAWRYAADEWISTAPEECKAIFGTKSVTLREACNLVLENARVLPVDTARHLFRSLHAQHGALRDMLGHEPPYSAGARCLITLMDEREAAYKLRQH